MEAEGSSPHSQAPPGSPTRNRGRVRLADSSEGPHLKYLPVLWAVGPLSVGYRGKVVSARDTKQLNKHNTYIVKAQTLIHKLKHTEMKPSSQNMLFHTERK